ncbi:peptidylprolyl isomerase SurA [Paraneptunicella aestuarii]|uniref:peptidylprolyl isomerase SurA n=1 Tax=Paraneptunicella aestuarii TaxID=2831148 RepID=UPI001E2904C2|nr:peptidylprolyl isomerase SurA [Paraneptunicella aestuarii]UAA38179.1 peptidylprolyl isomerase SurA [Paraneptunicella aestuarii]
MNYKRILLTIALLMPLTLQAKPQSLDQVAVIVDRGVILESEIQTLLKTVRSNSIKNGQTLPSETVLRTQAIERLITQNLQMQLAERMGIQVSDPQLEQTIANIAQEQNMSIEELRNDILKDGMSYDDYRQHVRTELITGEVTRANVRRRIYITPQEINNLVKLIDEQGAEQVEYHLGHILIGFPSQPSQDDIDSAKNRAEKVLQFLKDGSDFSEIAATASSGAKALEGGDLGWMNENSMPTLFAEAVQGAKKDALIGPIRSGAGFHILKIKDIRGQQVAEVEEVNSRHILIKPTVILSEERAQEMLKEFRTQVLAGEAKFEDLAKAHSVDPGSALKGGELGWSDPNVYVPAFKDALEKLSKGEISEPFRSMHGWHIVQLIDKRVGDVTEKLKTEKAYQLLFQRKYAEERDSWLREMRNNAFVEIVAE